MNYCLNCQSKIPKRNRYCNNKCQQDLVSKTYLKEWLETGKGNVSGAFNYVKKYLLEIQDNKCAICQIPSIWRDEPLRFVCDHIDGDSTNSKSSNLRMICPNCDSQLPTFKSRNRGKGRHSRKVRYRNNQSY